MAEQASASAANIDAANALMRAGIDALEAGDVAGAVTSLQQAAQHAPQDPNVLHNLGCALLRAKRLPEAANALQQSVRITNSPLTWTVLADLYESAGRRQEAFGCYKNALKVDPNHYPALMKLGAIREAIGDKPGARDCYGRALGARPRDFHATAKYTAFLKPEAAVPLWEDVLAGAGDNLELKAAALEQLVCSKEWWERIRRGEMPYHASRLDELFFNYAQGYVKEWDDTNQARLAKKPGDPAVLIAAGLSRFSLKDRHGAERLFRMAQAKIDGQILDAAKFDPAFYDELRTFSDADLIRSLPHVIDVAQLVPDGNGILYLSCNFTYFRAFALPMVVSLAERSPQTPVHLHIMDADEAETDFALAFMKKLAPLKFALSVERPGLTKAPSSEARSYYHAVRFIRFYEHLRHYGVPLWLMDVDALINTDLGELFATLKNNDIAMRIRPGRREPWNQFNACVVGAGTSDRSLEYIRLIAAYLAYFFQRKSLRWGIDQLAMYGVFVDMEDRSEAPCLALLGEREVDYDYRDDGFVWCNSGAGKFQHLQRIANPDSFPLSNFEGNKFLGVFERYWKECERIAAAVPVGVR